MMKGVYSYYNQDEISYFMNKFYEIGLVVIQFPYEKLMNYDIWQLLRGILTYHRVDFEVINNPRGPY